MRSDTQVVHPAQSVRASQWSPTLLVAQVSLLFAIMGVGVKWASKHDHAGEIVL